MVSSATRYAELLHRLLKQGEVSRENVISSDDSAAPLETATAADFLAERKKGGNIAAPASRVPD